MIAVDSNVLIYAFRADMPEHPLAAAALARVAEAGKPWAIPWPCAHEFLGKVTNPRIFRKPASMDEAIGQIHAWAASPWFVFLPEAGDHLVHLADLARASQTAGARVHDAKIAAICLGHDVDELWTVDRDFRRFPGLRVVNPLVRK
jgi:toxin-antitoxin system PIN domain toxin